MSTVRSILTPAAVARLALGWGAVLALALSGSLLEPPVTGPVLVTALAVIVGVVLVCAFGVVHEAEHLARRLGDPYGSLVLTLSIVVIEVILISAVMLGPGEHATIARDSVMAVSMIILNLVVGLALLVGGRRHGDLAPNRTGTSQYLAMLVVLVALAFGVPAVLGTDGAYTSGQAVPVVLVTVALYAFFLAQQTGAQAGDFREVATGTAPHADTAARAGVRAVVAAHRTEVLLRAGLLVATVLPIVLLSHDMAALLDDGLGRLGAPTALAGVLIAMIVFLPESITSVRAALAGEIQRVSNLCHGALVSTVGLTIPAVLVIGMLTGQTVVLAESPANLLLLGVSLLLSVTTFSAPRVTATHGAAHLAVFAVYAVAVMS
ncbi:calcium:proton antiporter [Oceanitalea stevensii]|uniref:Calcium:proton antiporter n=1 Tax=Oceanitalea stevensii TaxID=2763072 RepID=A0ABR8Z5G3_9MICO|nr:calcium:proton antiporter [Oceanitalea stevensii]MBD8063559.1 calcium:proton antiporter [Oceanitalea stevensii]